MYPGSCGWNFFFSKNTMTKLRQMYIKHISPHTYPPQAAGHSPSCFPLQQLSVPHCRRCPPPSGFGFDCHGDCCLEGVPTGSWVAGSAPGAAPGSLPRLPGPAALRPADHQLRPPASMIGLPMETGGGASLWGGDREKLIEHEDV